MKNFQNKTKIVKVSEALRIIALAGLFLWVFGTLVLLLNIILMPMILHRRFDFVLQDFLPFPMFVLVFIANLKLFRFFARLKKGFLFDSQTVGNLSAAGKWLVVLWLYEVASRITVILYWHYYDFKNFPPDLGSLFAALTLIFVAWLLKEAQELQEEQELTV
jgi:hypothetical protein